MNVVKVQSNHGATLSPSGETCTHKTIQSQKTKFNSEILFAFLFGQITMSNTFCIFFIKPILWKGTIIRLLHKTRVTITNNHWHQFLGGLEVEFVIYEAGKQQ